MVSNNNKEASVAEVELRGKNSRRGNVSHVHLTTSYLL